jgi:hypothetical protein
VTLPPPLYTCEPVLTEAAHFLGSAEPVLAAVAIGLLVCPWDLCDHHARVRELVRKYADQPMDLTGLDRRLSGRNDRTMWDSKVVTVDTVDFKVYRRHGRHATPLLTPED